MRPEELKPNVAVTGPIYPEPVQVLVVIPLGTSVTLIGKGLQSQKVYESVLNPGQEIDIGNVEAVLDTLTDVCYYLTVERTHRG